MSPCVLAGNVRAAVLLAAALSSLTACMSAQDHRAAVANTNGDRVTVGIVQREIRIGMPSSDVVSVLGAPNMVTTDDQRRESWVYDRIATERAYSSSTGGVNTLFLGGGSLGALLGGGIGGGMTQGAGASSTTQRTLTIVIKFDDRGKVRDFSYRSSSF